MHHFVVVVVVYFHSFEFEVSPSVLTFFPPSENV